MTSLCQNTADPLLLSIRHNSVAANGNDARAWGVFVELGEPAQPFSIRPSIDDFTMVALSDNCLSTDYACIARRGGVYNPEASSANITTLDIGSWNGTIQQYDDTIFDYHNDVLTIPQAVNTTEVWGWPFVSDDKDLWATRNWLGLGLNSSFLTAAVDSGAAPSKSWGMWTGSRSIDNPQDGMLVLGGYDNARKGGDWKVFPGSENCPTCVQISNMEWVDSTNNATSLFNGTYEAIQVALDPWYDTIRVPQAIWEVFGDITKGVYDDDIGYLTWPAGTSPKGSLRVTLQGGHVTTIPASEIFTKPRAYNSSGDLYITDNTTEFALIYNTTSTGASSTVGSWGLPFLTMNYLVVDVPKKEFWLTPAVRQDFQNSGGGGALALPLCSGLAATTPTSSSTPTPTSPTPGPTSTTAAASGGGTPTGAIVGGVVGGVGGLALIALLAFLLLRRRNRSKKEAEIANSSAYPPAPPTQQVFPPQQQHYVGPAAPPGVYSPTHNSYPSPPFGNSAHNSVGYAPMPMGGFSGPRSDYSNDHTGPQFYSPSPSVKPEHASMVYSDTATAVPELASPGQHHQMTSEWRGERDSNVSCPKVYYFPGFPVLDLLTRDIERYDRNGIAALRQYLARRPPPKMRVYGTFPREEQAVERRHGS
ncbi:hypothetical protein LTR84_005022 [Exophiala bonariae]|uniref:Epidermal growth factor receptor-like transmembrane-juxtamembrane segment domain-containing protein n=1 Tax=Exophiala bonariae TaxID=1690606 RepID=A0AAV9NNM8_9EURO|nr:hypothetical protein LTR84_005022 [Exophiala bonariae]